MASLVTACWSLFLISGISGIEPAGMPGDRRRDVHLRDADQHLVIVGPVGPGPGLDDPLGVLLLLAEQDPLGEHRLAEAGDDPALVDRLEVGRVEVDRHADQRAEVDLLQGLVPGVGQQELLGGRSGRSGSSGCCRSRRRSCAAAARASDAARRRRREASMLIGAGPPLLGASRSRTDRPPDTGTGRLAEPPRSVNARIGDARPGRRSRSAGPEPLVGYRFDRSCDYFLVAPSPSGRRTG